MSESVKHLANAFDALLTNELSDSVTAHRRPVRLEIAAPLLIARLFSMWPESITRTASPRLCVSVAARQM